MLQLTQGWGLDPGHAEINWSELRSDEPHLEVGTTDWPRITEILELGSWGCGRGSSSCVPPLPAPQCPPPRTAGSPRDHGLSVHSTESSQCSVSFWTKSSSCFF